MNKKRVQYNVIGGNVKEAERIVEEEWAKRPVQIRYHTRCMGWYNLRVDKDETINNWSLGFIFGGNKMKIFLSGAVSDIHNYKETFAEAEERAKKMFPDSVVVNPSSLPAGMDYIIICLTMLRHCDAIVMLPNYKESPGACCELNYANITGKRIIYL